MILPKTEKELERKRLADIVNGYLNKGGTITTLRPKANPLVITKVGK